MRKIRQRKKTILTLVSNACRPVIELKRNKRKTSINNFLFKSSITVIILRYQSLFNAITIKMCQVAGKGFTSFKRAQTKFRILIMYI